MEIKVIKKYNNNLEADVKKLALQLSKNTIESKVSDSLKEILKNNLLIAAFENEELAGIIFLMTYPMVEGFKKGWIEGFVVDENHRRKGIGGKLIEKALEEAKKMGLKNVNLTSRAERVAANNLYKKLGFEKIETNVYRINI